MRGSLYGIKNSSRGSVGLWGKNQFNSSFPISLLCYMRDNNIKPIYLQVDKNLKVVSTEISVDELFNTTLANEEIYFDFEAKFEPYEKFLYDNLERVDLVIREAKEDTKKDGTKSIVSGAPLRALEVKLTVVPDNSTCRSAPENWYPEIVIRPATTMYCALGMASSVDPKEVNDIFLSVGSSVSNWGNKVEAQSILPKAIEAINTFQEKFYERQRPLIIQPIWRTNGKKPTLDDNAFDIFIWSDFALARVFTDLVMKSPNNLTRFSRSALRLTRYLYEYGRAGAANIHNIYADMTYGQQSDKEFSLNGLITQKYMRHPRMAQPIISRDVVKELILDGGEKLLSPERRFDQTIYFTYSFEIEEDEK